MKPAVRLAIVAAILVVPTLAFAQAPGVLPVTALTPYSVIVTVLTLLVGVFTTVKNTGNIGGKPIPANVLVWLMLVAPFVGGVTATLVQAGSLTSVSAFNAIVAGLVAVTAGATPGLVTHAALHAHLKVPQLAAAMRAPAVKVVLPLLLLAGIASTQTGCLSSAPIVPVTPANQAQVTTCENAATLHNDFVIGDFAFTGLGGAAGAAGALVSDGQAKTDLAIGAAVAGAGAIVASSIVALSASDFANNQCSSVVEALPSGSSK